MEDLTGLFVVLGVVWFIIALIVGNFGKNRTIGFTGAFYASLLLSPLLAMLFIVASDKKVYTGLSSGEKVALFIPLGLIGGFFLLTLITYIAIDGGQISDVKIDTDITFHSNKSISLNYLRSNITIDSAEIPAFIKIIEKGIKLANICDSINSVQIKKHLGNINDCDFYFERNEYNELTWSGSRWIYGGGNGSINISSYNSRKKLIKRLTTDRDKYNEQHYEQYYEQLKAYEEKKRKDEEILSKF
jgi:hypothetical protein